MRERVRPIIADEAKSHQFLAAKRLILHPTSRNMFLDYVTRDFFAALTLLARRARGDHGPDSGPSSSRATKGLRTRVGPHGRCSNAGSPKPSQPTRRLIDGAPCSSGCKAISRTPMPQRYCPSKCSSGPTVSSMTRGPLGPSLIYGLAQRAPCSHGRSVKS